MNVIIIGAGLAGSFLAVTLGRQCHDVAVYDRLPDPRTAPSIGPSMNLGLSRRGLAALDAVGLSHIVQEITMPMRGRLVHMKDGNLRLSPYGSGGILAVQRRDLTSALIDAAARMPNVRFTFQAQCIGIDKTIPEAHLRDESTAHTYSTRADIVVGADGIHSVVRRSMQSPETATFQQRSLDTGWRELVIPPDPDGNAKLANDVFHLWPRGDSMMFAHPNLDGSFTASCVMPLRGSRSLESLRTDTAIADLFADLFPDVPALIPNLTSQFRTSPTTHLMSITTSPWHHDDKVVLIGDASHAVYPFLAQGMNSAFEDGLELATSLQHHSADRSRALAEYYSHRKTQTDALAEMSASNYVQLRKTVLSPVTRIEGTIDRVLHKILGKNWIPLHAMVTNTTIPYAMARTRARRHRIIVRGGFACAAAAAVFALARLAVKRSG